MVKGRDPDDVTRAIGGILNSQTRVEQMRQLAFTARRDPDAFAGLRKGIADYIQNRFVSNTEAATSGQGTIKADAFQSFVKDHEAALRYVFSPDELKSMQAIAADLNRSNRSISAVKLPNQSNAAQDIAALAKSEPSILKRLLLQGAGAIGGAAAGAATATGATLPAMAGWLGVKTIAAFRDAGMKRVDDVLRGAMLNRELAKALLDKVPTRPDAGTADRLTAVLRKAALAGAAVGATVAPATQPIQPVQQRAAIPASTVLNALAVPANSNAFARTPSVGGPMNALAAQSDNRSANNSLARAGR